MDSLMLGLSTTAIGMLVVFFGLVILICCIWVMTKITGRSAKKQKAAEPVAAAPVEEETATEEETEDDSLVAVIAAAISAVWSRDGGAEGGFVVRRIKRVNTAPAWQRSARDEQAYGRM